METMVEPEVPAKVNRPGTFVKGDPRIGKEFLAQNKPPPGPREEPEPAIDPVLTAFRAVLKNDPRNDRGELEKDARAWRKKDSKGFLQKYGELEAKERAAVAAEKAAGEKKVDAAVVSTVAQVEDAGADRVVEAIERVLTEALVENKS